MYIGDLQMPSTKIIIPGSKALENVSASFIANKVVAEVKKQIRFRFSMHPERA